VKKNANGMYWWWFVFFFPLCICCAPSIILFLKAIDRSMLRACIDREGVQSTQKEKKTKQQKQP
jgi:hypothetical protein